MDPIRFERDLRVTIQALGIRSGGDIFLLQDDNRFSGVLVSEPAAQPIPHPAHKDYLEVI